MRVANAQSVVAATSNLLTHSGRQGPKVPCSMLNGLHFMSGTSQRAEPGPLRWLAARTFASHPQWSSTSRFDPRRGTYLRSGGPATLTFADNAQIRPGSSVSKAAAASVEPIRAAGPGPYDYLFAGLAGKHGWVQSPGSVENAAQRILACEELVISLERTPEDSEPFGEAITSAVHLAQVAKAAGKNVSVLTDDATAKVVRAALMRDGTDGVPILTARPGHAEGNAIAALAEPGRRVVLGLGATDAVASGAHDAKVALSRYPSAGQILAAGLEQTQLKDGASPPFGGERVHAPTAGDAGYAVALQVAANIGRDDLIPTPESRLAQVRTVESDLQSHTAALDSTEPPLLRRPDSHIASAAELIRSIALNPAARTMSGDPTLSPLLVAAFDSSNGAFLAAKNAAGALQQALRNLGVDRGVNIAVVTDHANAPYGPKSKDELVSLVIGGLTGSALLRPDVVMMACNTACTAFPQALDQFRSSQDTDIPVLNLIATTVDAMKNEGGSFVSLFSTMGTFQSGAYQNALKAESIDHEAVGCPDWADMVNENLHLSDDPAIRATVQESVDEHVDYLLKQAPETTTNWLCCTHYPALKPFIENALKARGRDDIKVIDPMTRQAEAVALLLKDRTPRELRGDSRPIYVATSGQTEKVRPLAATLLGDESVQVFTTGTAALERSGGVPGSGATDADLASLAKIRRHTVGLPADPKDALLQAIIARAVNRFAVSGGPRMLAQDLSDKQHVMLLTGFSVAENTPETDGPPGTAVLAKTLVRQGKNVTIVTDAGNERAMRAAFAAIAPPDGKKPDFVVFDPSGDTAEWYADAIIGAKQPDAVVAIELPGRNSAGIYPNMRGANVGLNNAPVDRVLVAAGKLGIFTAGIGDGGNEAGVGSLRGIPEGKYDGATFELATEVTSTRPVTAWNSNFGAIATAIEMEKLADGPDAIPTESDVRNSIEADVRDSIAGSLRGGAVDGVTREVSMSVDGFSANVHVRFAQLYKEVSEHRSE